MCLPFKKAPKLYRNHLITTLINSPGSVTICLTNPNINHSPFVSKVTKLFPKTLPILPASTYFIQSLMSFLLSSSKYLETVL